MAKDGTELTTGNGVEMQSAGVTTVRDAVESALQRIDGHRFIRAAYDDQLSLDQVTRWVMCAGRESRSFPEILANMLKRTKNPIIANVLQANLDDEYGNGNPEHAHFRHYIHLLERMDLSEENFVAYTQQTGISYALQLASSVSLQGSPGVALGYMLVNEGMTPITYGAAGHALQRHLPALQTSFFTMHVEVDAHHVEELYLALEHLDDSDLSDVLFGVELGERGMAALLDEALGALDEAPAGAATVGA